MTKESTALILYPLSIMQKTQLKSVPEAKHMPAIRVDVFSESPKILPLPSTKTDMIITQTTNARFILRVWITWLCERRETIVTYPRISEF